MFKSKKITIFSIMFFVLTGCGMIPKEEEYHVVTIQNEENTNSNENVINVLRGDLKYENSILVSHKAAEKSSLSFAISGVPYDSFYVEAGDEVKKGELLAKLDCQDCIEQKQANEFELKRKQAEYDELDSLFQDYAMSKADYERRQADLSNEIEVIKQKLQELETYIQERSIYADIDGVVTQMGEIDQAGTSVEGKMIYLISGGNQTFEGETNLTDGLEVGKQYGLTISDYTFQVKLLEIEDSGGDKKSWNFLCLREIMIRKLVKTGRLIILLKKVKMLYISRKVL